MCSPAGTGSCRGLARGLWAGGASEVELEDNGMLGGCWHHIRVGRSSPVPRSPLGYGTFTFLRPIQLLGGGFSVLFNPRDKDRR